MEEKKYFLEEKIELLNRRILNMDLEELPIGLFHGKMGVCFYYFILSRETGNKEYRQFAEKLLNDIFSSINIFTNVHFGTGLSGIAWAISYLLKNKYIEGNVNKVLQDIDDKIFLMVEFDLIENSEESDIPPIYLIHLLFYSIERLKAQV